jgi:hypothetical protein
MPDPSNKRVVALSLRPLNRVSLCFVRSEHVVGVVLDDIILDCVAVGSALWPSFDIDVRHVSLLESFCVTLDIIGTVAISALI